MSEKNRNIYLLKSLSLVYGGMIAKKTQNIAVMPRKRHVSRNLGALDVVLVVPVMPRKRHVSRNEGVEGSDDAGARHASQEACE